MSVKSYACSCHSKFGEFEINLRMSESIEEIKLTYGKATVRTSDRLLTFEASGLPWKELRF